jgi:hypothetical protein
MPAWPCADARRHEALGLVDPWQLERKDVRRGAGRCLQDASCDVGAVVGTVWIQSLRQTRGTKAVAADRQRHSRRKSTDVRSQGEEEPPGQPGGGVQRLRGGVDLSLARPREPIPRVEHSPEAHFAMTRAAGDVGSRVVRVGADFSNGPLKSLLARNWTKTDAETRSSRQARLASVQGRAQKLGAAARHLVIPGAGGLLVVSCSERWSLGVDRCRWTKPWTSWIDMSSMSPPLPMR